ncbi:serine hydrolase [Crassaminicella profunda]|uniref:serine hydrolase n=1 Tax=Crassaminicella profunda TaxID=1286698 RepID=UPI001CA62991|nr:serine hydrolase [Crassaminicella profunda]QZY54443.1 class A beta-lactamase-related serine hydrolase [Crassaminicella profunda]
MNLEDMIDHQYMDHLSIFYKNLQTKECYMHKAECSVPSASIIKVFIMANFFERVQNREFDLHETININDFRQCIVSGEFIHKEIYSYYELLELMIEKSCNDATNIFIEMIGIDKINTYLVENNYRDTLLIRKMLDFKMRKEGQDNLTSGKDVATLLERIYHLELPYSHEMMNILKMKKNKHDYLFKNHTFEIASKYGDLESDGGLDEIKNDVAIVFTQKGDYILSIFTWGLDKNIQLDLIYAVSKYIYDEFMKA